MAVAQRPLDLLGTTKWLLLPRDFPSGGFLFTNLTFGQKIGQGSGWAASWGSTKSLP